MITVTGTQQNVFLSHMGTTHTYSRLEVMRGGDWLGAVAGYSDHATLVQQLTQGEPVEWKIETLPFAENESGLIFN